MVLTRAQARALSGHDANSTSQPVYYEIDDGSAVESAEEYGDDEDRDRALASQSRSAPTDRPSHRNAEDEDDMLVIQYLSSVQSSHRDAASSDEATITLQSIERPDDAQPTTVQADTNHQGVEEAISRGRSSRHQAIDEKHLESGPPTFHDLLRLEFYQTFPHDPAAILCKTHFLQLAGRWFRNRQGHTEKTIYEISQKFPYGRVESLLRHTRDLGILAQVEWDEPWREMPHEEFMELLQRQLHNAEEKLRDERHRAIVTTGKFPRCALEGDGVLGCGYCLALKNNGGNLYELIEEGRQKGWHGEWRDGDEAAREERKRKRIKRKRGDKRLDVLPAYVSLGGLHFIADGCNGETMIRFQ